MAAPQAFAVAGGLVTTLQAGTGLGVLGDGSTDVPVLDGPVQSKDQLTRFVVVGWNGEYEGDALAGTFAADFANLGPSAGRNEDGQVECTLVDGSGDAPFATLRTRAAEALGYVDSAIRADPSLGLAPEVYNAQIAQAQWAQGSAARGSFVKVTFIVSYSART